MNQEAVSNGGETLQRVLFINANGLLGPVATGGHNGFIQRLHQQQVQRRVG